MRAVIFFISLFSLLLWADFSEAATAVAPKSDSGSFFSVQNQLHAATNSSLWTVDEDIDANEEIPVGTKVKEKFPVKIYNGPISFFENWQGINRNLHEYKNRNGYPVIHSSCGSSTPIYISQRVLRI